MQCPICLGTFSSAQFIFQSQPALTALAAPIRVSVDYLINLLHKLLLDCSYIVVNFSHALVFFFHYCRNYKENKDFHGMSPSVLSRVH